MRLQPQSNDNQRKRPQLKVVIKKFWEPFVYMGFFPFSRFLLVSILVLLCALKVWLLECEIIECFRPENVYRNPKPRDKFS